MALTVVVWAGFALSVRGIGASTLTVADAALIRFGVPVLLLAPWIPRTLRRLRGERPAVVAGLCAGAGLPYFLVAALGGSLTSAALVGLVIPGTVPVFVALLAYRIQGLRISRPQAAALAVIVAGVAVAADLQPAGIVLILAGLIWAVYTMSLRVTVLDPIGTAIVLCLPSLLGTVLLIAAGAMPSHLATGLARPADIALYLLVQGVGVGVLAGLCYPVAIRHLGGAGAATLGALSPVVTALAAIPLLGETIAPPAAAGLALVAAGVVAYHRLPQGTSRHVADPTVTHRRHALAADRGLRP